MAICETSVGLLALRFSYRSDRVGRKNPQNLTQLSPKSHPRHLVGKKIAQKEAIKDITSASQVNSYFQYRWSPGFLTFNIYFYLFWYLYITRIMINNGTPHLKSPKNQNRRAALGRPAIKLLGGGAFTSLWSTYSRPWFWVGSSDKTIKTKASHHKTTTIQKTLNIHFYLFSSF